MSVDATSVETTGWGERVLRATVRVDDVDAARHILRTSIAFVAIRVPWVEELSARDGAVRMTVVASRTLRLRAGLELRVEHDADGAVTLHVERSPPWLSATCRIVVDDDARAVRFEARVRVLPVVLPNMLDAKLARVCADMATALAECVQLPRRMRDHRAAMRDTLAQRVAPLLTRAAPVRQHQTLTTLLESNVVGGKMQRSFLLRSMVDALAARGGRADAHAVEAMCWKVEVTQAFMLIEDDVMDVSETRRGAPTWWRRVGTPTAINDGLILMALGDCLLGEVVDAELRGRLRAAYDEVQLATTLGQALDVAASASDDPSTCTHAHYEDIVLRKTAYYTFYDPIAAGILLARLPDAAEEARLLREARELCMRLGWFFQVQDDYLDCFGDPTVTGKVGTDLEDRKHTWLLAEALERDATIAALYDGAHVEEVRARYEALGIPEAYAQVEQDFVHDFRRALGECHPALAAVLAEITFALQRRRM